MRIRKFLAILMAIGGGSPLASGQSPANGPITNVSALVQIPPGSGALSLPLGITVSGTLYRRHAGPSRRQSGTDRGQLHARAARLHPQRFAALWRQSESRSAGPRVHARRPATLLIRAVGPSLAAFGIANGARNPGFLLLNGAGKPVTGFLAAAPSNWVTAFPSVGAFPLAPAANDLCTAITLPAGSYTMTATDGTDSGLVLLEVYLNPDLSRVPLLVFLNERQFCNSSGHIPKPGMCISHFV